MTDKKNQLLERKDIEEKYKWDLTSLYGNDKRWEEDFEELKKLSEEITEFKGNVTQDPKALLKVIELKLDISRKSENIFTYAKMRLDEDTRKDKYQGLNDKAKSLMVQVEERLSFIVPEILKLSKEELEKFMEDEQELKQYKHYLDEILRKREHILSPTEEAIIAQVGDVANSPEDTFSMLNNADIKFPEIKNEDDETVEITHGKFIPLMMSKDRRVRKEAFEGLYKTYEGFKNTFASTLTGEIKKNIFYSKIRKYDSALQASLDTNNIPTSVYDNLIKAVHDNLDSMHKYVKLRKKALKLDELHMYDLYTPIVKNVEMKIPYDEGQQIVLKGLNPLGKDYLNRVEEGLENNWIDVYENKGKRSGAYSWGTYDSNPFILLNYQDTLDNVFTLAHEMGHSLHSYYSRENQPYVYGGYSIFVAEVASTANEALLMDYMLKNTNDKNEKLYLLNHYLEQFRGTVYRQTMFAEFEKLIHEEAEKGESITSDKLSNIYKELNEKYYGSDMVIDEEIAMEWARIPHFYYNFYVFQYATGFSAAVALAQKILNGEEKALDKYIGFLSSGSSDYPINVLKKAGVDMTSPQPVDDALKLFGELVDEMEKLMAE
ncbi:oligoendopeptidase F [Sporosalibacterium faouarense]|uniref:oligoendopeptidase F n=1 Tax=Sporosalibacterium faouarense TaxID=516123 RepID=UPI00141D5623|nr:oligoendopeptidase F [Sporosalibacterium faouarense]MTI49829.1 oligoendopeptidase F [Bacillota bacterium]